MFRAIILLAVFLPTSFAVAQTGNVVKLQVKNKDTKANVAAAIAGVKDTDIRATADQDGRVDWVNSSSQR